MSFEKNGWGLELLSHYSGKADILCRGYSGYNTRVAKEIAPSVFSHPIVKSRDVSLITIFWGANDSVAPGSPQHIPIDEYKQNLRDIYDCIIEHHPKSNILFITPPPVDEKAHFKCFNENSRVNEVTQLYATELINVAKEKGALYLDIFTDMIKEENFEKFFIDGLHFSAKGNKFLFNNLIQFIDSNLPHLRSDNLSFEFPYWKLVDFENPSSLFKDKNENK